jgi:hypothetical protein
MQKRHDQTVRAYAARQRKLAREAQQQSGVLNDQTVVVAPRRRRVGWPWRVVIALVVIDVIIGAIYLAWRFDLIVI